MCIDNIRKLSCVLIISIIYCNKTLIRNMLMHLRMLNVIMLASLAKTFHCKAVSDIKWEIEQCFLLQRCPVIDQMTASCTKWKICSQ